jgi:ABC-2 type transport system ATP-binding protein
VRLLELIRELARNGACVLYTTHYMEEAETLCDRRVIIDCGRIIAQGTLQELRALGAAGSQPSLESLFIELTGKELRE